MDSLLMKLAEALDMEAQAREWVQRASAAEDAAIEELRRTQRVAEEANRHMWDVLSKLRKRAEDARKPGEPEK